MSGCETPGGCERCGRHEPVTYSHWMFLCAECRVELVREKEQETRFVHQLEEVARGEGAKVLTGAGRAP